MNCKRFRKQQSLHKLCKRVKTSVTVQNNQNSSHCMNFAKESTQQSLHGLCKRVKTTVTACTVQKSQNSSHCAKESTQQSLHALCKNSQNGSHGTAWPFPIRSADTYRRQGTAWLPLQAHRFGEALHVWSLR